MKLITILKQLHTIEPDKEYAARSRAHILATPRLPRKALLVEILMQSFESGSAIALAGLALVAIVGGVSLMNHISPFGLSSLDPVGLSAEAQAVDIQIQLTDLSYREPQSLPVSTLSTASRIAAPLAPSMLSDLSVIEDDETVSNEDISEDIATPVEPAPSIDELLEELSR